MAILRLPAVKQQTGDRSDTSIYDAIREGRFTKPIKLGARASGWPDYEVATIVAARIAGKNDDQIRELVQRLHAERAGALDRCLSDSGETAQQPVGKRVWLESRGAAQ